jgi:3-oxoacyl-[acyl-carrier protein] reductase
MLQGKTAVITGCSRGIGNQIYRTFVSNGCNVIACLRKPNDEFDQYATAINELTGIKTTTIYFDFNDLEQIKSAAKEIFNLKIPIDILVNNAGITYNSLFQMTPADKLQEVFNINFFHQFMFIQYISKIMLKQKFGNIVNIASTAALDGTKGRSAYGASKASMISLTMTLAEELAPYIRVNAISPGITDTDMVLESMTPEIIKETIDKTCLKRMGNPRDIANVSLFLASDLSSYITKQVIRVDGGLK